MTPRRTYECWENGARRVPGAAVVAAEALSAGVKRNWTAILTDAEARGLTQAQVAREVGVTRWAVGLNVRRLGINLPRYRTKLGARSRMARRSD